MKTLLTGATGLLGGALLELLIEAEHEVRCLLRESSPNATRLDPNRVEIVRGDSSDETDLSRALRGVDALVHVAGIEHTPQVLEAMRSAGVERLALVGSTSVHSRYEFRSGMRRRMEVMIHDSGLRWTIARPAMIYGSELDKNMRHLLRFLDRSPVFPIFGSGENLWQPVYYEDCASGVLAALENPAATGQNYDLPGAEPLSYRDLVLIAARALGRKPRLVSVPLEPARLALKAAEAARLPLPVKSEQVLRLREDKAYSYEKAERDLCYAPRAFAEGIALEVSRLLKLGMVR
jgi:nucleoside-diphosphate-sugar epimerase